MAHLNKNARMLNINDDGKWDFGREVRAYLHETYPKKWTGGKRQLNDQLGLPV